MTLAEELVLGAYLGNALWEHDKNMAEKRAEMPQDDIDLSELNGEASTDPWVNRVANNGTY